MTHQAWLGKSGEAPLGFGGSRRSRSPSGRPMIFAGSQVFDGSNRMCIAIVGRPRGAGSWGEEKEGGEELALIFVRDAAGRGARAGGIAGASSESPVGNTRPWRRQFSRKFYGSEPSEEARRLLQHVMNRLRKARYGQPGGKLLAISADEGGPRAGGWRCRRNRRGRRGRELGVFKTRRAKGPGRRAAQRSSGITSKTLCSDVRNVDLVAFADGLDRLAMCHRRAGDGAHELAADFEVHDKNVVAGAGIHDGPWGRI